MNSTANIVDVKNVQNSIELRIFPILFDKTILKELIVLY